MASVCLLNSATDGTFFENYGKSSKREGRGGK